MSTGLHIGGPIWHIDNLYLVIPMALFAIVLVYPMLRRRGTIAAAPALTKRAITTRLALGVFGMFLIQSFHMLEHFAQVVQKFALDIRPAHGLIGTLDLEWVHVLYNTAVIIPMVALFLTAGFHRRGSWPWKKPVIAGLFTAAVLVQGYHINEHLVKIIQHIQTGIQGTPGILGPFFDLALLHYYLNIFQYLPIMFVFFGYGFHHWVWAYLRGREFSTSLDPFIHIRIQNPILQKQSPSFQKERV
ncbi:MAG: hypothetical protein V3U49_00100 [Nitrososphaerales archaeon]